MTRPLNLTPEERDAALARLDVIRKHGEIKRVYLQLKEWALDPNVKKPRDCWLKLQKHSWTTWHDTNGNDHVFLTNRVERFCTVCGGREGKWIRR